MRAVALDFETRSVVEREIAEPRLTAGDQALFRLVEVGICGTDRALAAFRLGRPPEGQRLLVIGHEALGQVVEAGPRAGGLAPGDWVVPSVRRACSPPCVSCARGRRDLCLTGGYTERGILGADGYFTELAVDSAADLIRIAPALCEWAILIEPLSVVEKAVDLALRLHEGEPRLALVLGAGTIGILAALALAARGLTVCVHSIEPPGHPRARLLADAGIEYSHASDHGADIILEAAGSADAAFAAMRRLRPLGVMVIIGAQDAVGEFPFMRLLLNNQRVAGIVNASPASFAAAVRDLALFRPDVLGRLIERVEFGAHRRTLLGSLGDTPKVVHVINTTR